MNGTSFSTYHICLALILPFPLISHLASFLFYGFPILRCSHCGDMRRWTEWRKSFPSGNEREEGRCIKAIIRFLALLGMTVVRSSEWQGRRSVTDSSLAAKRQYTCARKVKPSLLPRLCNIYPGLSFPATDIWFSCDPESSLCVFICPIKVTSIRLLHISEHHNSFDAVCDSTAEREEPM